MIKTRTKSVQIVLDIEEPGNYWTEKAAKELLERMMDSDFMASYKPRKVVTSEFFCEFCKDSASKIESICDDTGFPCCCEKAQREFIDIHKQIFTDPENQPNQYGVGLCNCGNLYDQKTPELVRAKMCEVCLDNAQ